MSDHRQRVLLLGGKQIDRNTVAEALGSHFDIDLFDDPQAAMSALRREMYAAIFADVGDFLPLERALFDRQAALVLNTIGEGVCIVDDNGVCVWANNKMRSFPPEVYDRVKQTCLSAQALFENQVSPVNDGEHRKLRSKKFGFQMRGDRYFEMIVSPVIEDSGAMHQVVAVVWDASSGRRLQQKIDAIDNAGRELCRLGSEHTRKTTVTERLKMLEEKIIRFTSDLLHFDHFCIRLLNKESNRLELVIAVGLPPEATEVDLYAQPEGNGISGYVAATGRSYICHDVEKDPRYVLGLDHAKSSLTVPLRLRDRVIGIFNIESQTPGAFNEDDRQFAEIFGRYIAIALNTLDLLVVERLEAKGQIADDVAKELAGPINDILTETRALMDDATDQAQRQRLASVVSNVESIRDSVQRAGEAPRRILGAEDVIEQTDSLLAGKHILVADDEPDIRNTIANVSRKMGAKVFTASNGAEAVTLIDQQPLDLIVSDIKMPHRNGYEIFSAARRRDATLPVILMTGFGYDPNHCIVRASQEGMATVLFKPFKVEQLLDEMRKALSETPADSPAEG